MKLSMLEGGFRCSLKKLVCQALFVVTLVCSCIADERTLPKQTTDGSFLFSTLCGLSTRSEESITCRY